MCAKRSNNNNCRTHMPCPGRVGWRGKETQKNKDLEHVDGGERLLVVAVLLQLLALLWLFFPFAQGLGNRLFERLCVAVDRYTEALGYGSKGEFREGFFHNRGICLAACQLVVVQSDPKSKALCVAAKEKT